MEDTNPRELVIKLDIGGNGAVSSLFKIGLNLFRLGRAGIVGTASVTGALADKAEAVASTKIRIE